MKVLLRKNIAKLGRIGDVVEVKPGYARNYLLPQGLAIRPTEANVRAVEAERQQYLQELARQRADLDARASALNGREVTIAARANPEGHLYGSVGPAQIVAALAEDGIFLQPENIVVDPPIRRLDKYEVAVRFAEDITALIYVWVVPLHEGEAEVAEAAGESQAAPIDKPGGEGEQQSDPQAAPEDSLAQEEST